MTGILARPSEIAALADALHAAGSVRVPLDQLWGLWTTAAPRLAGDPDQAATLSAALDHLASQGVLELPATAWDTSTTPPLPRFIRIPAARQATRDREWMRFPWRYELGWVASLPTLSDARLRDLIAINDWLVRTAGGRVPVVPVRYRSAEIFGDEKCLDGMARTNLFGPGRLSLDMLACVRKPAPLPAAAIGAGPDVLVVENSDPYWVAIEVLGREVNHPIGIVAWGCGKAFPSQVAALATDVAGHGPVTGRVWYWGDLDPAGLRIAEDAAAAANAAAVPQILPATGLWKAMGNRPVQDEGKVDWSTEPGRDWLGAQLWDQLTHIRTASGRVAQESVPPEIIASWASGIGKTPLPYNAETVDEVSPRVVAADIVKEKVIRSVGLVRARDRFLLEQAAHERSVTHKLAEYFQHEFPDYNVDCEYNRHGLATKVLPRECEERAQDFVYPDIVVHVRGNDDCNLLVIEAKLGSHAVAPECDATKLKEFTKPNGEYHYQLGLFIGFDKLRDTHLVWYKDGQVETAG